MVMPRLSPSADLLSAHRRLEERLIMQPFAVATAAESGFGPPSFENIVGVGIGEKITGRSLVGALALRVYVMEKIAPEGLSAEALIPTLVDGAPTDVLEVGELWAQRNVGRARPAEGGISVGHLDVTAGTIAALVQRARVPLLLSNNHVLANCNAASKGDPIVQPGIADGGSDPSDRIGELIGFVPLNFAGRTNTVDCAVARVRAGDLTKEIKNIGSFNRKATRARLGQVVIKTGRTTQTTQGIVTDRNFTGRINYGTAGVGVFRRQIVVQGASGPFSDGGDSGSLVLDYQTHRPIGLLFGGSSAISLVNPIGQVLRRLRISF